MNRLAFLSLRRVATSRAHLATEATTSSNEISKIDLDQFLENIGTSSSKNHGHSFAKMLRDSKFMQLGDVNGRVVVGKIVHRMHDDIYIDVGLKFSAVCKVPAVDSESYRTGSQVLVRVHDTELSERFLGSKHDLTLMEADATLIRLLRSGHKRESPTGNLQSPSGSSE